MHGFLNSAINSLINHCNVRLGYVARLHTDDGHPNHTSSYVMMMIVIYGDPCKSTDRMGNSENVIKCFLMNLLKYHSHTPTP